MIRRKINDNSFFEIINFRKDRSKLPVNLWLDTAGSVRNIKHKKPTLKIQNNKSEYLRNRKDLIPISISANPEVLLKNYRTKLNISEKELEIMINFIAENYIILLKHWNGEIDDYEVLDIMNSIVAIKENNKLLEDRD